MSERQDNPNHLPWTWEYRPDRGCVIYDCRGKEVATTFKEKRADYIVASADLLGEMREVLEEAKGAMQIRRSFLDDSVHKARLLNRIDAILAKTKGTL